MSDKKNESSSDESVESSEESVSAEQKKPTETQAPTTTSSAPKKSESSEEEEAASSSEEEAPKEKPKKVRVKETKAKKTERTQSPVTSPSLRKGMSRTKTGMPSRAEIQNMMDPFRYEARLFYFLLFAFEVAIIIIYAIWADYDVSADGESISKRYNYTRDVNIMIFFGFGFLMCFLRRYAYSAIGYTFLVSAMVAQWSMFLQSLAEWEDNDGNMHLGIFQMVNGLFCAGAVMISYGALLGKVTPVQMVLLAIIEPMFYWVNIYVTVTLLEVVDIGGGMTIHTFGAYFGLAATWFLTSYETRSHKDNTSAYNADIFSLAGTLFLWIMWPSFNAAVADTPQAELRALMNTFLSITASVLSGFLVSRMVSESKFDAVHIQNSTLAGGVAMGVAAHLNLQPAGAIGCGFLAGMISVLGYKYLTPLLSKKLNIQDVCGINNLHGMPGILSCLIGIFAALVAAKHKSSFYSDAEYTSLFPQGDTQAGYQTAGLFITLGIGLVGGCVTGFIMMLANRHNAIKKSDFFNDRTFWNLPTDYEYNIFDKAEENSLEMKDIKA